MHNRKVQVNWNYINQIKPLPVMYKIDSLMTRNELDEALHKLLWHKAPGRNRVTLNILKALNNENRQILLSFIHQRMCNDKLNYDD